ncbi:uncharacterized protein LOC109806588 isoform X1 [Cajanus cajan]|uniref:Uncharacterized protein n=1 Tax=Cajanus cajan TaxID=3821 RepID=A0A151SZ69_CAJCA|nr:uncharacterized protein LOC109806588 isoform X1 [Cajanus cajan]KYP60107.1 hypothetical protein KK1_015555 [Cajanus cajan]
MALHRGPKPKPKPARSPILVLVASVTAIALLFLFSSLLSTTASKPNLPQQKQQQHFEKYLYWGTRIDCPGKHCGSCEGLGHQESSLRCALEEAIFLSRTFVMPSRMCINPIHNKKGILHHSANASSEELWDATSCAMESLYDTELMSGTVPVILDNSKEWYRVLSMSMKLGARGVAHVEGVSRLELKENSRYSDLLLINRTASPLSWFMECKDRNNRSAIMLPYSFLPTMAAGKLREAAEKIKALLGDYDAIHVRRGDKINTRKDRFGVARSLHPHLDRDTRPEFIICRIAKWVPPGRTLYIASNERTPGFFSPLSVRYRMAYSSNYSHILDPLIENNYQLFMIERLIMMGAKTFIRTFKEDETDLSLTDDPKKNTKLWQIPVYNADENC